MISHSAIYQFDLKGYLHFPGFLSQDDLSGLRQALDQADQNDPRLFGRSLIRSYVNHPRLQPYLEYFLGQAHRLDEVSHFLPSLAPPHMYQPTHPYDPARYYLFRHDRIYCGSVGVLIRLEEAGAGAAWHCLPGSHKSQLLPPGDRPEELDEVLIDTQRGKAGDLILYSLALAHWSTWQDDAYSVGFLNYNYTAGHLSLNKEYPLSAPGENWTREQRISLQPPYIDRRHMLWEGNGAQNHQDD